MDEILAIHDVGHQLAQSISGVFEVVDITHNHPQSGVIRLRGRLRRDPDSAYAVIGPRFKALGYTALLREDDELTAIWADPNQRTLKAPKVWVNALLLVLTIISVIFAGLFWIAPPQELGWAGLAPGLGFAASLLTILMAHEMGHYFMGRKVGVKLSLPLFIPFPFNFFGTMGAAEVMEGRPRNRRALLAVGAAGPLAGLLFAVPILVYGLLLSEVGPIVTDGPYYLEGNSLLYLGIKYLIFGRILPGDGLDVFIHPVAFAGWGGLFVTALNLIPVGQLDGGHILYALFGKRASWVLWPILVFLIILGTQWWAWYLWVFMLYFLGRTHAEPLDNLTQLRPGERALGLLMMIIAVLVFTPIPIQVFGLN